MNSEQVKSFEILERHLKTSYREMSELSKKKPNDPVNKFKVKCINEFLAKVNDLIDENALPLSDFRVFDEDDLPTASDIVFILSLYLDTMSRVRLDNTTKVEIFEDEFFKSQWIVDDKDIGTEVSQ